MRLTMILYADAVDLIIEMQTASVSMLQRRFRIGYTRAARLIDEMEARGIVGPYEGSKPRAVLQAKDKRREVQLIKNSRLVLGYFLWYIYRY